MKYLQVVKRAGMTGESTWSFRIPDFPLLSYGLFASVDKMEEMIGSFGPQKDAHTKIVSLRLFLLAFYTAFQY